MPISATDLAVFTAASLLLNLTPGNDMMFVLGQAMKSGTRAGVAASLGITSGSLIHLALVALGAGVLLAQHPQLFDLIRYAGAAYLVWLAWKAWTASRLLTMQAGEHASNLAAWREGVFVNLLNPKVIVFMFAFLPPFVRLENGSPLLQLLILGAIFNFGGTLINIAVAAFAGRFASALNGNINLSRAFSRVSAIVFVIIAARLAFSRS